MAIATAFNPPQFIDQYEGYKMRQLVDELERLHAALTRDIDEEGTPSTVDSFNGRYGDIIPLQADYDSFFLTPAEGDAAYAALTNVVNSFNGRQGAVAPQAGDYSSFFEPLLGDPLTDGQVLTSTALGVRSWKDTVDSFNTRTGAVTLQDADVTVGMVTQHVASIDHDSLLNFLANEHLDWTLDLGATNLNEANIASAGSWNTAVGWGDHAVAGYLKNLSEDLTPALGGNFSSNGFDMTIIEGDRFEISDGTNNLAFFSDLGSGTVNATPTAGMTLMDFNIPVAVDSLTSVGDITGNANLSSRGLRLYDNVGTNYLDFEMDGPGTSLGVTTLGVQQIQWPLGVRHTFGSTAARAALQIDGSGVAPTTPVNGDLWATPTDLLYRIGGVTKSLLTEITAGNGLVSTPDPITGTGTINMGVPGTLSLSSTNLATADSHTHVVNISINDLGGPYNNYVLPAATATALGGVELFSNTVQTVAANAVSATAARTYGLQFNAAGQAVVNVPWTAGGVSITAGNGLVSTPDPITGTGTINMGVPGTLDNASTNLATADSHTHVLNNVGFTNQANGWGGTQSFSSPPVVFPALAGDNISYDIYNEIGNLTWALSRQNTTASGDFRISRYNSAGVFQDNPLVIDEATGDVTFTGNVTGSNLAIANWNTAHGWGDHSVAGYALLDHIRSIGTVAMTGGVNPNITTAEFIAELEGDGLFDSYSGVGKTSWSYAGNYDLTDAGNLTETAGMSILSWTDNSSDTVRGNITLLAVAPNTGGSAHQVHIYNDQGPTYSPGWRQVWTDKQITPTQISNWDTAFGWGDHALAGYATGGPFLSLSGGTMTGTIVADSGEVLGALRTGAGAQSFARFGSYGSVGTTYSAAATYIANNAYVDPADIISGQFRTAVTHASYGHTIYEQSAGIHRWYNASNSVTAGAVVTKQLRMSLNASGDLVGENGSLLGWLSLSASSDVTSGYFFSTDLGPITAPASAGDAYFGGYGVMGRRDAAAVYLTNASATGTVQINAGGVHGAANKVAVFGVGYMQMDDSDEIRLGTGNDFRAYHNGTGTFLDAIGATNELQLRVNSTSIGVRIQPTGFTSLYHNGTAEFWTQPHATAGNTSGCETTDHLGAVRDVGFNDLKSIALGSDTTLNDQHCGVVLLKTVATAGIDVILPSVTNNFPNNSVVQIINAGNSTVNISASTNARTLYWLTGSTRTGGASTNRTLAYGAVVTIYRASATDYYIWGGGIS